jgi:hypothetical protein
VLRGGYKINLTYAWNYSREFVLPSIARRATEGHSRLELSLIIEIGVEMVYGETNFNRDRFEDEEESESPTANAANEKEAAGRSWISAPEGIVVPACPPC